MSTYAFPSQESYGNQNGLSKREYYAALAMQALIMRRPDGEAATYLNAAGVVADYGELAREAFRIANAMTSQY